MLGGGCVCGGDGGGGGGGGATKAVDDGGGGGGGMIGRGVGEATDGPESNQQDKDLNTTRLFIFYFLQICPLWQHSNTQYIKTEYEQLRQDKEGSIRVIHTYDYLLQQSVSSPTWPGC